MELLGGQNFFPRSQMSESFDLPAGCTEIHLCLHAQGRGLLFSREYILRRCECDATPYVEQPEVKECFVEHCTKRLSPNEDDLILG